MKESDFYTLAFKMIVDEINRAESFCDNLDKDTVEKKMRIDEYKWEKNRVGGLFAVSNILYFCNKHRDRLCDSYYLLERYFEYVKNDSEFFEKYESTDDDNKAGFALYYGALAYIKHLKTEKEELLVGTMGNERKKLLSYLNAYDFAWDSIECAYRIANKIELSPIEIEKALAEISISMCKGCADRISALPENSKIEKKAIQIEMGMYSMGHRAAIRYNTIGSREDCIRIKSNHFLPIMDEFPKLKEVYEAADDAERQRLTAALYGEVWMIKEYHEPNKAEFERARTSGDAKKIFEMNIKVGAIETLLSRWKEWRVKNGIYADILPGVMIDG